MIIEVLAQIRRGQRVDYGRIEEDSFSKDYLAVWKRMSAPDSEPLFRLFFEAYGIALRRPRLYKAFLRHTIEDWLQLITGELEGERYRCKQARAVATVVLAGLRGFMLDFCTTHDRKRLDESVELWLRSVDSMITTLKEV
jgi:hypothetical protein